MRPSYEKLITWKRSNRWVVTGGSECRPDNGRTLIANGSTLLPGTEEMMSWEIGDHGFVMGLSGLVPDAIASLLPAWLDGWLAEQGLARDDIATWAVHPGGPRILSAVERCLDVQLDVSRAVLREYGNMSSPTILFVLDRLRREGAPLPCVALGFGPGLTAEAMLLTQGAAR